MGKYHTYDYIKSFIEKENYYLLSDKYENSKTKLLIECDKGHKYESTFCNFRSGARCRQCISDSSKLNLNDIKEIFEKEGYLLLTDKYINSQTKLKYKCSNNHLNSIRWYDFKNGHKCPKCSGNAKHSYEYIKGKFNQEGYVLLSKRYENIYQKLKFICPNGHAHSIRWNDFQQGKRCKLCRLKIFSTEELREYKLYKRSVVSILEKNYKKYKRVINPNNLLRGRGKYHLDHIYSVIDGFKNSILPEIISNPFNLRTISQEDNLSKHSSSDITTESLLFKYDLFSKIYR